MAYENIENKKFLDSAGTGYLWEKIKQRYDSKLDSVVAADESVAVTNNNRISVQISPQAGNALQLIPTGNDKGLYVSASQSAETYQIVRDDNPGDYAAVYHLQKFPNGSSTGTNMGVDINIPKDMVVQSGVVQTYTTSGDWGNPGTYIVLTLANATNTTLYIPADTLVEYVTSGSQTGDMVMITIDPTTHQVTASISDGTITEAKLDTVLKSKLASAVSAVQVISEGSANGTISVDGTDVAVHGLGSAAYANANAFDPSGAASTVLGTDTDTAATATVYGVKKYASDVYASIIPLTTVEIDAAIAAANA